MYWQLFLALAVLSPELSSAEDSVPTNRCPQATQDNPVPSVFYYGHPDDCTQYYQCNFGEPQLEHCPTGYSWNDRLLACAQFNTYFDTCTQNNAQRICAANPNILIPHPSICHRFYNCSRPTPYHFRSPLREYDDECPYPELFDVIEKKCKPFYEAVCGPFRKLSKAPCDYLKNICGSAHCQPCSFRLPSCEGLPDGKHENPLKLWTAYYIECRAERLAGTFQCPRDPLKAVFSPVQKVCVSLWEVPRANGGYAPTCDGREDGQYRTEERPDVYFTCPGAQVGYCSTGGVFNETSQRCE